MAEIWPFGYFWFVISIISNLQPLKQKNGHILAKITQNAKNKHFVFFNFKSLRKEVFLVLVLVEYMRYCPPNYTDQSGRQSKVATINTVTSLSLFSLSLLSLSLFLFLFTFFPISKWTLNDKKCKKIGVDHPPTTQLINNKNGLYIRIDLKKN